MQNLPNIPVSLGGELLFEVSNMNLRIKTSLVGMEKGTFLLTKLSSSDLLGTFRSQSVRQSPTTISYLHDDVVYGFSSEVLSVVSNPSRLFFLSYPRKIEMLSARQDSRYECILPAVTMLGHEIVDMVITDISRDGCQGVVKNASVAGGVLDNLTLVNKKMEMKVQFPGTDGACTLAGIVRTVNRDADRTMIGVKFQDTPQDSKVKLDLFISLIAEFKKR